MIRAELIKEILYNEFCRQWSHGDLEVFKDRNTSADVIPKLKDIRHVRVAGDIDFEQLVQNVHAKVVQAADEAFKHRH